MSDKPGLREQLITSLAAPNNLSGAVGRECARDRVAALGAVQIGTRLSAHQGVVTTIDAASCELEPSAPSVESQTIDGASVLHAAYDASLHVFAAPARFDVGAADQAAADQAADTADASAAMAIGPHLASILVRLKYLHDRSAVDQAVLLLARVIGTQLRRKRDRNRKMPYALLAAIAEQVIAEWIAGACTKCHGTGRRRMSMGGTEEFLVPCRLCARKPEPGEVEYLSWFGKRRPVGTVSVMLPMLDVKGRITEVAARISCPACCGKLKVISRVRTKARRGGVCGRCGGFGHFVPNEAQRAAVIGVSGKLYSSRWAKTFDVSLRAVRSIDRDLIENLRAQLDRGIVRAN